MRPKITNYNLSKSILPVIVLAQFCCTSLWFAGNSIIADIANHLSLAPTFLANLTSAIQFGFIAGTLIFAILTISDRFSPSRVFFISSVLAGVFNLGLIINNIDSTEILMLRFLTGFFLAGIYPVGMKIASDHYQSGLGKSLGFLVGALVIGTAFPHLIKTFTIALPWEYVIYATTALSLIGGLGILLFVADGPHRKKAQQLKFGTFLKGFSNNKFRSVALGYFGHMWELYAFWAFVPVMLASYNNYYPNANLNVPMWSFLIIAVGGVSCAISGLIAERYGTKKIALISLILSCLCCLASPLFLYANSVFLLLLSLLIWGMFVIADSPLFSTLVAQNAPEESRGTYLTIVNCIGFAITIASIQLVNLLFNSINQQYIYLILAIGPLIGIIVLLNKKNNFN